MKNSINIPFAPKTVELENGQFLHSWYANNKGQGRTNCTIIRSSSPRAAVSAKQESVIAYVKTSHWAGQVNFSKQVQSDLGL